MLYRDRPGQINLYTTQPPLFESDTSGTNFTAIGNAEIRVKLANGTMFHAFTLKVFMGLKIHFGVSKGRLVARASNVRIQLSVKESFIGDIKTNIKFFNEVYIPMASGPLLERINKYGAMGFPLPMVDDIVFVNTKVSTGKHYTLIETDAKYTPGLTKLQFLQYVGKRNEIGPQDDFFDHAHDLESQLDTATNSFIF